MNFLAENRLIVLNRVVFCRYPDGRTLPSVGFWKAKTASCGPSPQSLLYVSLLYK